jgi:hypothetical protein
LGLSEFSLANLYSGKGFGMDFGWLTRSAIYKGSSGKSSPEGSSFFVVAASKYECTVCPARLGDSMYMYLNCSTYVGRSKPLGTVLGMSTVKMSW